MSTSATGHERTPRGLSGLHFVTALVCCNALLLTGVMLALRSDDPSMTFFGWLLFGIGVVCLAGNLAARQLSRR